MDELKWELLTELQGKWNADLLKLYFEGNGVEVLIFQESVGQSIYPTSLDILGRVQVFVEKKNARAARKLLEEYNNPPKPQKARRRTATQKRAPAKTASARKGNVSSKSKEKKKESKNELRPQRRTKTVAKDRS